MAGNYPIGGDVGSYSHPMFTTQGEYCWSGPAQSASGGIWAHFSSRNNVLVNRVSVICTSSPSATAGTFSVIFYDSGASASTLKALTISACSAGWQTTMTFTGKTLDDPMERIGCKLTNNEKGDWIVVYSYQTLFGATYQ